MKNKLRISILTLFPDYFETSLKASMLGIAAKKSLLSFDVIDIRSFATDKHQTTDDRPFGGGPGMVMKVEPIARALCQVFNQSLDEYVAAVAERKRAFQAVSTLSNQKTVVAVTSAKGPNFTQTVAKAWSQLEHLVLICGHYEGIDERVAQYLADTEVRIGDYVLTGGEPAALVISDAVSRLVPGVLGNEVSTADESHGTPGVLGFPQYTRPEVFNGWSVPQILLDGHHRNIEDWRQSQKRSS